jgi:hypothetical protein
MGQYLAPGAPCLVGGELEVDLLGSQWQGMEMGTSAAGLRERVGGRQGEKEGTENRDQMERVEAGR